MKYLTSLFWLSLLSSATTSFSQSVNYNQALADLIPSKKWFEIEHFYQQHKDSINNEFVKLWYLAETGGVFNRTTEAIDAYEQLIDKNPLGMDVPTLTTLFGQTALQLCADAQEFAKGELLCRKLLTITQNDSIMKQDTRLLYIQGLEQSIENFKQFSKIYSKPEIVKNKCDKECAIKLIPNQSGNGIYFNAKWNGFTLRTHFDTGAGSGAYIYNRGVAEKMGIKLNTKDTITTNDGTIRGFTGIIDSLELGEFIIKNIPAYVNVGTIDSSDIHQTTCDSILNSMFDIVLGISIIKQLGVVEFDFVNNTMLFPQETKTVNNRNLYIESSKLFMNMEICDTNFLSFFDTGGDGGLIINTEFYEKHKQLISTETEATQTKSATGGCNEASISYRYEYNCPKINIKINDQEIMLMNDCVVAKDKENDDKHGAPEGGFLGNAILKYCKKAIFDFDNMVFSIEK